jgi:hypothetical protein
LHSVTFSHDAIGVGQTRKHANLAAVFVLCSLKEKKKKNEAKKERTDVTRQQGATTIHSINNRGFCNKKKVEKKRQSEMQKKLLTHRHLASIRSCSRQLLLKTKKLSM